MLKKPVFLSSLLYSGKPEPLYSNISTMATVYQGSNFNANHDGNLVQADIDIIAAHTGLFAIDWELNENPTKYAALSTTLHGLGKTFGYYGFPRSSYNAVSNNLYSTLDTIKTTNDSYLATAQLCSAFFPDLYTFYNDPKGWVDFAMWTIKECKRVMALAGINVPIYPYIWPQYAGGDGSYLDSNLWQIELDLLCEYADGFVLWGGYNVFGGDPVGAYPFNVNATWFQQVKAIVDAKSTYTYKSMGFLHAASSRRFR